MLWSYVIHNYQTLDLELTEQRCVI